MNKQKHRRLSVLKSTIAILMAIVLFIVSMPSFGPLVKAKAQQGGVAGFLVCFFF